jgi:hypothetical protein
MKTQTLLERHAQDIKGVIKCFDRVVLFGTYQAIGWTGAMEQYLRGRGTSFMELNKSYANELRLEVAPDPAASLRVLTFGFLQIPDAQLGHGDYVGLEGLTNQLASHPDAGKIYPAWNIKDQI